MGPSSLVFALGGLSYFVTAVDTTPDCHVTPEPAQITANCIDPLYSNPVIDSESNQSFPKSHYYIEGHFCNTTISFNFYFPPRDRWENRFYQLAYPTQASNATIETIGFGYDSGAYIVQVTGTQGYRAEAAAAKFSREVARRHYGRSTAKIYGYLYGGSGGSFQTVGAIENTIGVWDGAVPMVQAIPVSVPNGPAVKAMAGLVLQNKSIEIERALKPGGSADPYSDLNQFQQDMLREATLMGIPLRAWEDFDAVANSSTLALLKDAVKGIDSTYMDDFWTQPGYLGTEKSALGDFIRDAKIDVNATVLAIEQDSNRSPIHLELNSTLETPYPYGFEFSITTTNGTLLGPFNAAINKTTLTITANPPIPPSILQFLTANTTISINNKWHLALHTYYRHQVPSRPGFIGFNQFLLPNNTPKYPLRPIEVSKLLAESTSGGGNHTGSIKSPIIVIQNLLDSDAFPWHAHWYRTQVEASLGSTFDDNYRLWYNENADHYYEFSKEYKSWIKVPYVGIYEQALRDLSAWVEKGVPAPASTRYSVTEENDVVVSDVAAKRGGVQHTVRLMVEGKSAAATEVSACVGENVKFDVRIEVPPGVGKVVSVEWDGKGNGGFERVDFGTPAEKVSLRISGVYGVPGRYVPVVRVASHRDGDVDTPYARVYNMARVSVVVR